MARTTDKRERILEYITQFTRENGYSPSVREICEGVSLASTATVHYHLNALRQEGSINMDGKKNRTISLPDRLPIGKIPVVGVVTAGVPILAVLYLLLSEFVNKRLQKKGNIEGYLPWDGDESCFALRVRGDSMINAGILSGDKVVVRPQKTAENGQIVVALLDDSATVKRFHREKGKVWLLPENPAYEPIDGTDCSILGLVKAVVREY